MVLGFLGPLKGVLGNFLLDTAGLWTLLALIPLILVYLIRPKPKKQTIPALMFFMKENTKSDRRSFFRWFVKDFLFVLQILILLGFALTIAKPFITVSEEVFVERTAIVIDASASMQTKLDGLTRLERAQDLAKEETSERNAVIVIGSIPELAGNDLSKGDAGKEIDRVRPKDTPTSIFDAIVFAGNYVKTKDRIVVVSDFIETGSKKDVQTAKSIMESRGVIVDFINVLETEQRKAKNIGIVDIEVTEQTTKIQVMNFNENAETVKLRVMGANLSQDTLLIQPQDREEVEIDTPEKTSIFELLVTSGQDDFAPDNKAYISAPKKQLLNTLVISNDINKYLTTAIGVMNNMALETTVPPRFPNFYHNIIFFNNVKKDLMLPGVMKKVKKKVKDGSAFIIMAQDSLLQIDFQDMLPVIPNKKGDDVLVKKDTTLRVATPSSMTEDVNFGYVHQYFDMKAAEGATVIAETPDGVPMIVIKHMDKGLVVYYGIFDSDSDFKKDIYYPIFWKRLFDMAMKKQDINRLNFKTGKIVTLNQKQDIKTPIGKVKDNSILMDYAGMYETEEKTLAANLINEEESNINGEEIGDKKGIIGDVSKKTEKIDFNLAKYFIIGLSILIFIELLWIKFRGDL